MSLPLWECAQHVEPNEQNNNSMKKRVKKISATINKDSNLTTRDYISVFKVAKSGRPRLQDLSGRNGACYSMYKIIGK